MVSDKADYCPKCGYNLNTLSAKDIKKIKLKINVIEFCSIILGLITLFWLFQSFRMFALFFLITVLVFTRSNKYKKILNK